MKIAVSAQGRELVSPVDPRFGRAGFFIVVDGITGQAAVLDNTISQSAAHGAGIQAAKTVVDAGATVVLTGAVGPKAFAALRKASVAVYEVHDCTVAQAVETFKTGKLVELASPTH